MKIKKIFAYEILDSRGYPTVEVIMESFSQNKTKASVPSGASTGFYEAWELRDDDLSRYQGKGVKKAVENILKKIAPQIIEQEFSDQIAFDNYLIELDGTNNKSNLGTNAILPLSLAFAKLQAQEKNLELYEYLFQEFSIKEKKFSTPMINILNGGKHADNSLQVQEFMIVPVGFDCIEEKIRAGAEIFHCLKNILKEKWLKTGLGDEGGFSPNIWSIEQALDFLLQSINEAGYNPDQIKIALDVASSEFFSGGKYLLNKKKEPLTTGQLINYFGEIVQKYPIISIEDPLDQDDWLGWSKITEFLGEKIKIVWDDLLVTNSQRLLKAIDNKACNSVLIKLNQIGTLTETIQTIKLAQEKGFTVIISHRSGETNDTFIADLAYAMGADFIKTGSMSRGERIAKYNRLLEIKELIVWESLKNN